MRNPVWILQNQAKLQKLAYDLARAQKTNKPKAVTLRLNELKMFQQILGGRK